MLGSGDNIHDNIESSRRSGKMSECQEGVDDGFDLPGSIEAWDRM
jgi:hypothetical protein